LALKLRKKIIDQAIEDLSKGGLGSVTIPAISQELGVEDSEIFNFFSSREEILVAQQDRLWKVQFTRLDKYLKKAKTPAEFKITFEKFFDLFVANLREDHRIQYEVFSFVPACLEFRAKLKKRLKKLFTLLIKKGWPGKTQNVLERQSELVLLSFVGFMDHIIHISPVEREKILKDFKNMLNLHLQDRLFF